MSEDEPKTRKKRVTKASVKAATTMRETDIQAAKVGPTVTPSKRVRPHLSESAQVLLEALSARIVVKDNDGRYVLGDRAATQRALSALGDQAWVSARMTELEDAVRDLEVDPGGRHGFVI